MHNYLEVVTWNRTKEVFSTLCTGSGQVIVPVANETLTERYALNMRMGFNEMMETVTEWRHIYFNLRILMITLIPIFGLMLWIQKKRISHKTNDTCNNILPPGRSGWPVLGETIEFILSGREYFRSRVEKHGCVFRTHLMGKPAVVVVGAANVRKVLTASESQLSANLPPAALSILGYRALCATAGNDHRRLQRAVLNVFTHRNLAAMTPDIQVIIRTHINSWIESNSEVKFVQRCRQMTFEVANLTLLGFDFSVTDNAKLLDHFEQISEAFFSFPIYLPGFSFYKGIAARDAVTKMLLEKRKRQDGRSLFDCLFADKTTSLEEITSLALELMFGGNQTIASMICAALITLKSHPAVVARMREEVASFSRESRVSPNDLTYTDITSLSYIGDVVKELLRLKPSIAGGFRKTIQPFRLGDYTIPEGYTILYGITDTHEASQYFEHTKDFRPCRWQEARDAHNRTQTPPPNHRDSMPRYDYLPFGGGRRYCVGKELAKLVLNTFLIELVTKCDWTLLNGEPRIKTAPIPFPVDGLPVKFTTFSSSAVSS